MDAFHEGQKVWVSQADGSQRSGIFVSDAEIPGWFGGAPAAYVVYPDTRSGEEVSLLQITPRDRAKKRRETCSATAGRRRRGHGAPGGRHAARAATPDM